MVSDQLSKAAQLDLQLEKYFQAIESDPELKSRVSFVLQRKPEKSLQSSRKPRCWKKLMAFRGPDHATREVLTQHAYLWVQDPSLFLQPTAGHNFTPVAGEPYANLTYLALQCIWTEQTGVVATLQRRVYRVVLSRLQKQYDVRVATLAASLVHYCTNERSKQALEKRLKSMLDAGSRLDYWIEKFGSGAIFVMGQESGDELYECLLPTSTGSANSI